MFTDGRALCRDCKLPKADHRPKCPTPPRPPIPCPLCGGRRHRKEGESWYACAWRQWANDQGWEYVPANVPDNQRAFADWHAKHPDLLAGSVHAERLIRQQRKRAG